MPSKKPKRILHPQKSHMPRLTCTSFCRLMH